MRDSRVSLAGGRTLAYTDIGEPDWPCVFFFHGAPGSRLHLAYLEERFLAERIRVVSLDRPAYGGSSPQPGRSMADWPPDVAALADALGIARFGVAGHSSGGPYAVACAALLPERVSAGIVLGGVTDMGWPGAWEGYVDSECELMRMPDEAAAVAWCVERYGEDGKGLFSASDFEWAEPDKAIFADGRIGPALKLAMTEALQRGVTGYAQDIFVQGRPWPFDPKAIAVPVHVLHGELDALVPLAHSCHTSEVIPGSTMRVLPGHGHVTTLAEIPSLASALARSLT
ncbi:MAG: alpha/beta fold hydrolase [Desulfobacterales bacterium]